MMICSKDLRILQILQRTGLPLPSHSAARRSWRESRVEPRVPTARPWARASGRLKETSGLTLGPQEICGLIDHYSYSMLYSVS